MPAFRMMLVFAFLAAAAPYSFAQELSLDEALRAGERQSPRLAAQRYMMNSAEKQVGRAAELPDPKLRLGIENLPVTGADRFRYDRDFMSLLAGPRPAIHAATSLGNLVAEALQNNPEIRAAQKEKDAAQQRIAPAAALDDPMLEAGIINLPTNSPSFNRDDMTMKMIGLSQRLPYPGKRDLRQGVASKDAESVGYGYQETVNRVAREIRVAYFDLGLVFESIRLTEKNKLVLDQFLRIAEARYAVGQGSQADALKAQTQSSRMIDELIKLGSDRLMIEAELNRVLGRGPQTAAPLPETPQLKELILRS